jgi:hypothetical protein
MASARNTCLLLRCSDQLLALTRLLYRTNTLLAEADGMALLLLLLLSAHRVAQCGRLSKKQQ